GAQAWRLQSRVILGGTSGSRCCRSVWQGPVVLAVQISRHGGPEVLTLVEHPDPVAAAGQVVVRNRWIGVNYVDLQHRAGQPYPVRLPLIPGTEAAGTVVAVGAGADPGLAGAS